MQYLETLLNYNQFAGDMFFVIASYFVLGYAIFKKWDKNISVKLRKFTLWSHVLTLAIMFYIGIGKSIYIFEANYISDTYSYVSKIAILLCGILSIVFNPASEDKNLLSIHLYYPLVMLATVGGFIFVSANSLIYMLIGFVIISLTTGVMTLLYSVGYKLFYRPSGSFLLIQGVSFSILLFAVSFIYSITGSTSYDDISLWLQRHPENNESIVLGLVIITSALGTLVGAFPFSNWVVKIHTALPSSIVVYLRTAVVVAVMMSLGRLLYGVFDETAIMWKDFMLLVGVGSILVGTTGCIIQDDIDKLYGYSSIGHIGFLFLALGIGTVNSISAMIIYMVGYILSYVAFVGYGSGIFVGSKYVSSLNDLEGFGQSMGTHSVMYGISALAFVGIPPFVIFFGKMSILGAILSGDVSYSLIALVVVGVFQGIWVLRLFRVMYFPNIDLKDEELEEYSKTGIVFTSRVERGVQNVRRLTFLAGIFFLFISYPLIKLAGDMASQLK